MRGCHSSSMVRSESDLGSGSSSLLPSPELFGGAMDGRSGMAERLGMPGSAAMEGGIIEIRVTTQVVLDSSRKAQGFGEV